MNEYPPVLTRPQAAAMCQLTPSGFDVWVRKGIVPTAIPGTRRWSRDAILAALSGAYGNPQLDAFQQWEDAYEKEKAERSRLSRKK